MQGTDKKTGHAITLFWCSFSQGWNKELNRPSMFSLFAWHDTVTGEFINTTIAPTGKFESSGSSESDFGFKYSLADDDGKGYAWSYDHAGERWNFKSFTTDKSKIIGKPYSMDIYYYTAPEMEMKGSVTLADGVHDLEGVAWFEHQWGNFRNTECARYFWGYARFDNGDSFTWRQYYGNPSGVMTNEGPYDTKAARVDWNEPHPEVNRFAFIPKGQAPQYSFGPSFLFTPIKWWTSPTSDVQYPWWGEMKTPKGTFYLSPTFPAQESVSPSGAFIEGALLLRQDSIDGPVVARGFCELAQMAGRGISASRQLPERTDIQFNGGLK